MPYFYGMAQSKGKSIIKFFFGIVTIIVLLLYVPALFTPLLNTTNYAYTGFLSLAFPYTATILMLLCLFWLTAKPKWGLGCLIILAFGYKNLQVVFSIKSQGDFKKEKQDSTLRIITWNVQSLNGLFANREAKKTVKEEIAASINNFNADVVCLQEFNTSNVANNIQLLSTQYPYHFFPGDYFGKKNGYKTGCIIFSKFPLSNTGWEKFTNNESIIYADINYAGKTIRVYTTHLQSFKFNKNDYEEIDNISTQQDVTAAASKNVVEKLKNGFEQRGKQVTVVQQLLNTHKELPTIFCGDLNDVPASYTYFGVRGGLQDAFLQKQIGVGRTYISLAPTLRIDYIFTSKNFNVKQFDMIDENLSDHLMLVADVAWQ